MNRISRIIAKITILINIINLVILLIPAPGYTESVKLLWDAPTANEDQTPLTDLAGFKVYRGTSTGTYDYNVDAGNVLCYIMSGLSAGTTYYFAATAYDTSANESAYSNEVSTTIQAGNEGYCNSAVRIPWKVKGKSMGGFTGGFQ